MSKQLPLSKSFVFLLAFVLFSNVAKAEIPMQPANTHNPTPVIEMAVPQLNQGVPTGKSNDRWSFGLVTVNRSFRQDYNGERILVEPTKLFIRAYCLDSPGGGRLYSSNGWVMAVPANDGVAAPVGNHRYDMISGLAELELECYMSQSDNMNRNAWSTITYRFDTEAQRMNFRFQVTSNGSIYQTTAVNPSTVTIEEGSQLDLVEVDNFFYGSFNTFYSTDGVQYNMTSSLPYWMGDSSMPQIHSLSTTPIQVIGGGTVLPGRQNLGVGWHYFKVRVEPYQNGIHQPLEYVFQVHVTPRSNTATNTGTATATTGTGSAGAPATAPATAPVMGPMAPAMGTMNMTAP